MERTQDYAELSVKPTKQVLNALVRDKMSLYPFSLSYLQALPSGKERDVYCQVNVPASSHSV